jgi:5-methylcytosine-specific restriction protein A
MKSEIKCENPECSKIFLAWPSANKKYCSQICYRKVALIGDNNPMKKQVTKDKMSNLLTGRKITWGNKISDALKTSDKAKQLHFKKGKDNIAYGKGHEQKGKLNPNWKGGTTTKNQLLRSSDEYIKWRKVCMERDDYKCTVCSVGGYLQVHHIKELAKYPDLACDIDNGKTVCINCHNEIHGRKVGKLTKEQVIEIKHLFNCDTNNLTLEEIGKVFNVTRNTIKGIKYNKTWKNIII